MRFGLHFESERGAPFPRAMRALPDHLDNFPENRSIGRPARGERLPGAANRRDGAIEQAPLPFSAERCIRRACARPEPSRSSMASRAPQER
jgi:hypothetical protein